jgi:hypothetical protein
VFHPNFLSPLSHRDLGRGKEEGKNIEGKNLDGRQKYGWKAKIWMDCNSGRTLEIHA